MTAAGILEEAEVQFLYSTRRVPKRGREPAKHLLESVAYENEKHSHCAYATSADAKKTHESGAVMKTPRQKRYAAFRDGVSALMQLSPVFVIL
jgi:hypothetical protein